MNDLVVPQTPEEAEALQAAEELLGNKLLARSEARKVLDEQRSATFKHSRATPRRMARGGWNNNFNYRGGRGFNNKGRGRGQQGRW